MIIIYGRISRVVHLNFGNKQLVLGTQFKIKPLLLASRGTLIVTIQKLIGLT